VLDKVAARRGGMAGQPRNRAINSRRLRVCLRHHGQRGIWMLVHEFAVLWMGGARSFERMVDQAASEMPSLASIERIFALAAIIGENLGFVSASNTRVPSSSEYPIRQPSFSTAPESP